MNLMGIQGGSVQVVGWRVSSRCADLAQTDCVEVGHGASVAVIGVRDSKNPFDGTLTFTEDEWAAFTGRAKAGVFDR